MTPSIRNRKAWLQQQIDADRPIYDVGIDPNRLSQIPRSPYYNMERQTLVDNGYQRTYSKEVSFVDSNGRNYIVSLYQWKK